MRNRGGGSSYDSMFADETEYEGEVNADEGPPEGVETTTGTRATAGSPGQGTKNDKGGYTISGSHRH